MTLIKNLFASDREELKKILSSYKKKKINELSVTEASTIIKNKNCSKRI